MMVTMDRANRVTGWMFACFVGAMLAGTAVPAAAQEVLQLDPVKPEYSLGRFRYSPPSTDGWRQIANSVNALQMVYAEKKSEDKIETRFGVAFEAHDIPPNVPVSSAAQLAELSRSQISEQRKADLVSASDIQPVPSIENLYTYRLLVHPPIAEEGGVKNPDAYEVYYVLMAPDKTQYMIIQCITKKPDYENDLYFTEFYASLVSLKYVPDPGAGAKGPAAPAATGPTGSTAPAATPPAATPPAAAPGNPAAPTGPATGTKDAAPAAPAGH